MITIPYAAGLIDAEGSIGLQIHRSGSYSYTYPRLSVSNTDLRLLQALQDTYGGSFRPQPMKGKLGTKQVYIWAIGRRADLLTLLAGIAPWLIVKKERAEQILGDCGRADFASKDRFAWLAGLIDGDGSIVITRKSNGVYLRVDLRLHTTSLLLANTLSNIVGGGIHERNPCGVGVRQIYLWQSYVQEENLFALRSIVPFLLSKREKAEEAVALIEGLQRVRRDDHPSRRPEVRAKIVESFKAKMSARRP